MKGFLQRMAASVVRTETKMHPFVGSIYAPRVQSEADWQPQIENVGTDPAPRQSISPAQEPESRAVTARPHQTLDTVSDRHYQPLAARLEDRPNYPEALRLSAGSHEDETLSFSHSPQGFPEAPALMESAFEDGAESIYVPLLTDRASGPDIAERRMEAGSSQAEVRAVAMRGRGRTSSVPPPGIVQPQAIQPEDIQIHIGRIEVIAVPPSQPRPAAAPVRKGLSLDEYLSRRGR